MGQLRSVNTECAAEPRLPFVLGALGPTPFGWHGKAGQRQLAVWAVMGGQVINVAVSRWGWTGQLRSINTECTAEPGLPFSLGALALGPLGWCGKAGQRQLTVWAVMGGQVINAAVARWGWPGQLGAINTECTAEPGLPFIIGVLVPLPLVGAVKRVKGSWRSELSWEGRLQTWLYLAGDGRDSLGPLIPNVQQNQGSLSW